MTKPSRTRFHPRDPRRLTVAAAALLFALLLVATSAQAVEWPIDPATNLPVCTASGPQVRPNSCSDEAGGAIVVWDDYRSGQADIYVQRLDGSGTPLWTLNGLPLCVDPGHQTQSVICPDGSGGALVAWIDDVPGPAQIGVQRVSATGTILWAPGGLRIHGNASSGNPPALAPDGSGGAYVAWTDAYRLIAQHVDHNGVPLWGDAGIMVRPGSSVQVEAVLVADMVGGVIALWIDTGPTPGSGHHDALYGQRLGTDGALLWSPDGLALAPGEQSLPRAISDGLGGAIACWTDWRFDGSSVIVAQRVTQSGLAVWAAGGLALSTLPAQQDRPVAASDGTGGAIFAWHDLRNAQATSNDIYAQHVSADGLLLWPQGALPVCTDRAAQIYATICGNGSGGAIVAWRDTRGDGDIYAQRLDGAGNAIWQPDGIPVCTAAGEQDLPQIVAAATGQGIVGWIDPRNGNADIYAQRIPFDAVVPVQVSLVSAEALDGMARIEWWLVASSGVLFDIERRTHDSEWATVEGGHVDGEGKIVHEDRAVIAGTEYGWRLQPRGSNEPIGEVWLAIPASAVLALEGPVPNPATEGLNVSFSLPALGRASLELFDVGGRVIASQEVGALGPGRHFVDFRGHDLRSGVYLLRLSTGSGSIVKRVAIAH